MRSNTGGKMPDSILAEITVYSFFILAGILVGGSFLSQAFRRYHD
jgi:hypothetical protein